MPRLDFAGRPVRLTYCTNALPGTTPDAMLASLDPVLPAWRDAAGRDTVQLGLWISAEAAAALDGAAAARDAFTAQLQARQVEVFTLNGFPFGDFHGERVKEDVFTPAWHEVERLDYTRQLGRLLTHWLGEGETGSISTLACGLKRRHEGRSFVDQCARQLLTLAAEWSQLFAETGRPLILGLEPEPGSTLETTEEFVDFYREKLLSKDAAKFLRSLGVAEGREEEVVRTHLGICYDLCHQAVEFESVPVSLDRLRLEGIPMAKLQITSALEVPEPGADDETLAVLARFAEPRYLHQVTREDEGKVEVADDLETLLAAPSPEWLAADRWRVHFHVPVHRETISGLQTTQREMLAGLRRVLQQDQTRHLEIETYTWGVLEDEQLDPAGLAQGIGQEIARIRQEIQDTPAD